jgi:glutaminyl-tRNA synthetase
VDAVRDERTGEVAELRCVYDPATRGGWSDDGRKVRGTLHWVSAQHALPAEVRLYDRLFTVPNPLEQDGDFLDYVNAGSLEVLASCRVEPGLAGAVPGTLYQFLRKGYYCVDPDSSEGALVFNRTAELRDTWAKIANAQRRKR